MGNINIEIPDELHRKLRHKVIDIEGIGIRETIIKLLEKYLDN